MGSLSIGFTRNRFFEKCSNVRPDPCLCSCLCLRDPCLRALGKVVKLQLNRIKKRVEAHYKIPFEYSGEVVRLVVSRCTESESGGRMIDAILTNTVLPDISKEFLTGMMEGRQVVGVHVSA